MEKGYCVYIMASKSGRLYTGMTNNLYKRVFEHKNDAVPGFTSKHGMRRLVHYEQYSGVISAINREKQIADIT